MTQREKNILRARVPQDMVKQRKGGGNIDLDYVEAPFVVNRLDAAFAAWSFEVATEHVGETKGGEPEVVVKGTLTAHSEDGSSIQKSQYGSGIARKGMDLGDVFKGAGSDALKKCATLLGVALELYGPEYYTKPALNPVTRKVFRDAAATLHVDPNALVKKFEEVSGMSVFEATSEQVAGVIGQFDASSGVGK